ncbi:MAG: hypothetical protein QOF09_3885 [Alphaproteobacteria bacterium]|jgi:hypothetical protein|nr:hypothetical protein [Alphaproteobacteria bacterium]
MFGSIAVLVTAGPDGSSQTGFPIDFRALSAGHYPGLSSRRPDRYAINLCRPRNLLCR